MSEQNQDKSHREDVQKPDPPSKTTFYRIAVWATIIGFTAFYVLSGVCLVKPEQEALVRRFGRLLPTPLPPGTHYRLPYPVDTVDYLKPNEVKSITIGGGSTADAGAPEGGEYLTGDENIIYMALTVQYKVGDSGAYLFNSTSPEALVSLAAETALTNVVARTRVDDLLTAGKQWVLAQVKQRAQERLDKLGAGIAITSANFAAVTPPVEVADAFKDVASALEDKDRFVNEATGEYNETIPRARGDADKQVQEATAHRQSKINRARGEADRFITTLEELRKSGQGELAVLRLYLETMETVLPRLRKYVVDSR